MKPLGLLKDCVSYNQVLVCYASNGKLRECGALVHQMISQNLSPNEGTFKVLFTVLKKGGFPIEAVAQLESSYRDGKPYAQEAAITALYSMVSMHALALESAQAFTEPGAALDSFAYNVAIYCYGSAGDVDKALHVYMKILDEEVEPDIGEIESSESLFKAIINDYKMANRGDLAELVSQEMRLTLNKEECSETETETETEDESDEVFLGTSHFK
ncbi:hypothetical protein K1719_006381 [Acacia pycnantha]|nr:hypothetical protein K1719_006381 [Acacia pycnantha]